MALRLGHTMQVAAEACLQRLARAPTAMREASEARRAVLDGPRMEVQEGGASLITLAHPQALAAGPSALLK